MKKTNQINFILSLLLLAACNALTEEKADQSFITPTIYSPVTESITATQKPTRIWTPLPSKTPTSTPLPNQLVGDFFIFDTTTLNMEINGGIYSYDYGTLEIEVLSSCRRTGKYGLEIKYEIMPRSSGPNAIGWDVGIKKPPLIDIKNYSAIEFWVKGTVGGEAFEIWIANEYDNELGVKSTEYVEVSPIEWRIVHIPFSDFNRSFTKIWGVAFYFNSKSGAGRICIDDIDFVP